MSSELQFSPEYTYRIKCIIMGDRDVGKSSLLSTYINERIPSHLPNEDLDYFIKKETYKYQNEVYDCKMHLWEMSGELCVDQVNREFIRSTLFLRANVFLLLCHNKKSFNQIKNKIFRHVELSSPKNSETYIIQNSGKNSDFFAQNQSQIQQYAHQQNLRHMRVDVINPQEVKALFGDILNRVMKKISEKTLPIEQMITKDREEKIVLKQFEDKQIDRITKRYNRCC